jgi:hypothetical protein
LYYITILIGSKEQCGRLTTANRYTASFCGILAGAIEGVMSDEQALEREDPGLSSSFDLVFQGCAHGY